MTEELVNVFEKDVFEKDVAELEPEMMCCGANDAKGSTRYVFVDMEQCCDDENCTANGEVIGVVVSYNPNIYNINPNLIQVCEYQYDPDADAEIDMLAPNMYYTLEEIEEMGLDLDEIAQFWAEW